MIGPVFAALSVQHPSLVFLTVDVDANEVRMLYQQTCAQVQKQHVCTMLVEGHWRGAKGRDKLQSQLTCIKY